MEDIVHHINTQVHQVVLQLFKVHIKVQVIVHRYQLEVNCQLIILQLVELHMATVLLTLQQLQIIIALVHHIRQQLQTMEVKCHQDIRQQQA